MERVRFAPSPTGPLHIGGLRTALFNYLYAKKKEGVFIVRIEDTDQKRKVTGSEDYIFDSLAWTGIQPDESPKHGGAFGPYRQSERKEIYQKYVSELIETGKAYYAFDLPEELDSERKQAEAKGEGFKYGASNRDRLRNSLSLSKEETEKEVEKGNYVIRLKVASEGTVNTFDEIRGNVSVNKKEVEDKVILKADGLPTYHFANVVDDHLMEITTVIRGEEWLPSLSFHQLLYDAFGWKAPKFMHLPLILNPSGKGKLSKRDGDKNGYPVFPLSWEGGQSYKEEGFLPEAHLNYIAQLGWSPEEGNEILSLKELVTSFSVGSIQKGGARFDYEKARWINQQHIHLLKTNQFIEVAKEELAPLYNHFNPEQVGKIVGMIKERVVVIKDIPGEINVFLNTPSEYVEKDRKRIQKFIDKNIIDLLIGIVNKEGIAVWKEKFIEVGGANEIGLGGFMQTLRIAIVGGLSGPDLFELADILGKDVTLDRLNQLKNL